MKYTKSEEAGTYRFSFRTTIIDYPSNSLIKIILSIAGLLTFLMTLYFFITLNDPKIIIPMVSCFLFFLVPLIMILRSLQSNSVTIQGDQIQIDKKTFQISSDDAIIIDREIDSTLRSADISDMEFEKSFGFIRNRAIIYQRWNLLYRSNSSLINLIEIKSNGAIGLDRLAEDLAETMNIDLIDKTGITRETRNAQTGETDAFIGDLVNEGKIELLTEINEDDPFQNMEFFDNKVIENNDVKLSMTLEKSLVTGLIKGTILLIGGIFFTYWPLNFIISLLVSSSINLIFSIILAIIAPFLVIGLFLLYRGIYTLDNPKDNILISINPENFNINRKGRFLKKEINSLQTNKIEKIVVFEYITMYRVEIISDQSRIQIPINFTLKQAQQLRDGFLIYLSKQ